MSVLVQKFGGTSVATPEARNRAVEHVLRARSEGKNTVVVVSAMGRFPEPYSTDVLLGLLPSDCVPEDRDLLASCGELISVAVMTDLLRRKKIDAEPLVLHQIGILTDDNHADAQILEIDISAVREALDAGKVPVVPGFQGIGKSGKITTLGRGGSDITAAALGAALGAELIEIYTDVEGVFSADPRVVPDARVLSEISFQEVGEMAYHGAKVLHPRAVSFAMERGLPLRIRSTFSEKPGTLLTAKRIAFTNVVTGIAHIPNMSYARFDIPETLDPDEARFRLFREFAEAGISLDLITVSGRSVYFIIDKRAAAPARKIGARLDWSCAIQEGFAKVSVVGAGMRGQAGVMLRVVRALFEAGIKLYHSTDSHITIACLVSEEQMEKAVRALHEMFIPEAHHLMSTSTETGEKRVALP